LIIVEGHGRLEAWNRPAAMLLGLKSPSGPGSRGLAKPAPAPAQAAPTIGAWPELHGLAEPGADEVDGAVAVLPGGAARVRSRRMQGDVAELAGMVLALDPMGQVSEGCVRLAEVIGVGPLMRRRLRTAEAATRGHGPVLVCGESGTGRRLLARAIAGATSERAAVLVDARALADGRGLFGTPLRPGLVEQAGPVPLVLTDADELEPEVSNRLLDALARRGAPRLFVTSRRPIGDLTRHLPREARERLAALSIELPPLRERPEELAALTDHLLERIAARLERPLIPTASPEVLDALRAHSWPGNVAELERVLFDEVARAPADLDVLYEVPAAISTGATPTAASGRSIAEAERHLLIQALQQHRGNVPRIARTLGVSRGTVYNMMRKYRIDPASYRVAP
jgi:DNA-binding NtrC family response regulator